jgi:hypothetical protein
LCKLCEENKGQHCHCRICWLGSPDIGTDCLWVSGLESQRVSRTTFLSMRKYTAIVFASILFLVPSVSSAKALTQVQINSIIQLLIAFNVDSATIAKVEKSLGSSGQQSSPVAVAPTPPPTSSAPVQTYPSSTTNPQPSPVTQAPAPSGPVASDISIQSSVCNLASTNLKTEYSLGSLMANGNIDGRIFMNAFILDQNKRNYYSDNPPATMSIVTSDHSNDKTLNGSGNTGPCGYYYPFEFYTTSVGTYTVTYSVPALNLSKTITLVVHS